MTKYKFKLKIKLAIEICALVVLLTIIPYAYSQGLDGHYYNNGKGVQCDTSGYTGTNATAGETGKNRQYNETTGLGDLGPYGQYYSDPVDKCYDCDGSCKTQGAYQTQGFDGSNGQVYDVELMECVDQGDSNKVYIKDPILYDFALGRSLDYYIDPDHVEIIELGTKQYPYKSIVLPFTEILYIHSNTNRSVNIYLKEFTVNYMMLAYSYIINMTNVHISTYTKSITVPEKADLVLTSSSATIFSSSTILNLITDATVNLTKVTDAANFTSTEIRVLSGKYSNIYVLRSSLTLSNLNIYSDLGNLNTETYFVKAIYLQSKSITMNNVDFKITGHILKTEDPMSLSVSNTYIDMYASMGGFLMSIKGNYPEAYTIGSVIFDNVTIENSQERAVSIRESFLIHSGPENITITNSNIQIYGTLSEDSKPVEIYATSTGNPDDDYVKYTEISNSYWSMPNNPSMNRFITFFVAFDSTFIRKSLINYKSNVHENIVHNVYPIVFAFTNDNTDITIKGNTYKNVSGSKGVSYSETSNLVNIQDEIYQDSSSIGSTAYAILYTESISMSNVTFNNVHGSSSSTDYYIHFHINDENDFYLESINFRNCHMSMQGGFYIEGMINSLIIVNSHFENLTIGSDHSIISTGEFHTINFSDITFYKIYTETDDDDHNFMIRVNTINLDHPLDSYMSNITISDSHIGFLDFNAIVGSTNVPVYFYISDITYRDSYFKISRYLFNFDHLESTEDFTFLFDNLYLTNLTFNQPGNIFLCQLQTLNGVILQNSQFSDIHSGKIHIEAFNKQITDNYAKMKFINNTIDNTSSEDGSFMTAYVGSQLDIINCSFSNMYTLKQGAAIHSSDQESTTSIYNSVFTNGSAIEGGVFFVENEAAIYIYDSLVSNNFAITSGVIHVTNDGHFVIKNGEISLNIAVSSFISQIYDAATTHIVYNSTINSNEVMTIENLNIELTSVGSHLGHLHQNFKDYLLENQNLYDIVVLDKLFQLIQGSLEISGGTRINNETSLIDAFISTVYLINIEIHDFTSSLSILTITSSTINITNCNFYDLKSLDNMAILTVTLDSYFYAYNITYHNSPMPFIALENSDIEIDTFYIYNITSYSTTLNLKESTSMYLKNWFVTNIHATHSNSPLLISHCIVNLIQNLTVQNIEQIPIYITYSTVYLIDDMEIKNSIYPLTTDRSHIDMIKNSKFFNLSSDNVQQGGGILLKNTNVSMTDIIIANNTAQEGAGIFYSCLRPELGVFTISNSQIVNNTAIVSGGGIQYDVMRPIMENLIIENNTAQYGERIASYPMKIKLHNNVTDKIHFSNAGSGIIGDLLFYFEMLDADDQIMILNSEYWVHIRAQIPNQTVRVDLDGIISNQVVNGIATFDKIAFISDPGNMDVLYDVHSDNFDFEKIKRQFNGTFKQEIVHVDFRYGKPGEYQNEGIGRQGGQGSYSFTWNSTTCHNCMGNAVCEGTDIINVNSGYWRNTKNSTFIPEGFNLKACLGGYNPDNLHPVNGAAGYDGYLCTEGVMNNGNKYEKFGDFECNKCPDPTLNAIRVVGVAIIVIAFMMALVAINIRKKHESQVSILMRIMTNYLQIMTATMSYSMKFPDILTNLFTPISRLGNSGDTLMSYDGFASDASITLFLPSTPLYKAFMMEILPILIFIGVVIFWSILHVSFPKTFTDFKRNVVVSMITLIFLMHPTLTKASLGLFQCTQIDDTEYKVTVDMTMNGYSPKHVMWSMLISLPMIVFWVIGCPVLALYILIKHRKKLDDPKFERLYIVLYQGFKHEKFYWEFVNTVRKVCIVGTNVFLSQFPLFYKGITAVLLILAFYRLQISTQPYKLVQNNEVENLSFLSSCMTLYGGLLFVNDEARGSPIIDMMAFVLIVFVNFRFLALWTYMMVLTQKKYRFMLKGAHCLRVIACKNRKSLSNKATCLKQLFSLSIKVKFLLNVKFQNLEFF